MRGSQVLCANITQKCDNRWRRINTCPKLIDVIYERPNKSTLIRWSSMKLNSLHKNLLFSLLLGLIKEIYFFFLSFKNSFFFHMKSSMNVCWINLKVDILDLNELNFLSYSIFASDCEKLVKIVFLSQHGKTCVSEVN